jgi:nucleotide-binding universal stress UspA family protein
MVRTVVAGPDGSPESRAAAEWAAREARLRGRPLKIVHVWEPAPEPALRVPRTGGGAHAHRTARSGTGAPADGTRRHIPRETAADLRLRHPDVDVTTEQLTGRPAEILLRAAERAELLVLGSRGLSGIGGFLVGSVGQSVVAHTEVPVVLVRAGEPSADALPPDRAGTPVPGARPVLLGLDTGDRADAVTAFAFAEAARRGTGLRVVHAWNLPPYHVHGLCADPGPPTGTARQQAAALTEALARGREEHPLVEVVEECRSGSPAPHLIDASREASLLVVGRRVRRARLGTHIGSVTHAVLHHAACPVAVVPHR